MEDTFHYNSLVSNCQVFYKIFFKLIKFTYFLSNSKRLISTCAANSNVFFISLYSYWTLWQQYHARFLKHAPNVLERYTWQSSVYKSDRIWCEGLLNTQDISSILKGKVCSGSKGIELNKFSSSYCVCVIERTDWIMW